MILTDILSSERVRVALGGSDVKTKDAALHALAELLGTGGSSASTPLAPGVPPSQASPSSLDFYRVLSEREALQSTGIGDGVAIPHGAVESLGGQVAAVLICPDGVPFDAIDGRPVRILFAVVGPKRATGEHLKTLARISRLLRDSSFREKLLSSSDQNEAYALIRSAEEGRAA
jgi:PTS system nitrogen regulatory IIA component